MIALLICEFVLGIYGFCQNAMDFVSMTQQTFTKSTTYKFLILMRFLNLFHYLLKSIVMAWLFFDWSEESCFYLAIGLLFTETSNISSMFGISVLRLITVIKKKKIINLDQLEDSLWKYIFPICLPIGLALVFTMLDVATKIQQVMKWLKILFMMSNIYKITT